MENLFYSEDERLAFWVSGYDISSYKCDKIINYLNDYLAQASKILGVDTCNIETYVIRESRRYRFMRVFYAKSESMPEGAFNISGGYGWTMQKWLSD